MTNPFFSEEEISEAAFYQLASSGISLFASSTLKIASINEERKNISFNELRSEILKLLAIECNPGKRHMHETELALYLGLMFNLPFAPKNKKAVFSFISSFEDRGLVWIVAFAKWLLKKLQQEYIECGANI